MKIELTEDERDFLCDKAFWAKANAELDTHIALTPKAKEFFDGEYKFYNDLYNKLKGDDGEK